MNDNIFINFRRAIPRPPKAHEPRRCGKLDRRQDDSILYERLEYVDPATAPATRSGWKANPKETTISLVWA
jgi:hypothetical protein